MTYPIKINFFKAESIGICTFETQIKKCLCSLIKFWTLDILENKISCGKEIFFSKFSSSSSWFTTIKFKFNIFYLKVVCMFSSKIKLSYLHKYTEIYVQWSSFNLDGKFRDLWKFKNFSVTFYIVWIIYKWTYIVFMKQIKILSLKILL